MLAFLTSCFSLVAGLVIGAGIARWGAGERALHGHRGYPGRWAVAETQPEGADQRLAVTVSHPDVLVRNVWLVAKRDSREFDA
jgi:hypothetical protein